jgi:hypothetical protein
MPRRHYPRVLKESKSVTLGVNNTYGSPTVINFFPPYYCGFLDGIQIVFGGTFGTGETATAKIEFLYEDGTQTYIEKSATATGTIALAESDLYNLLSPDKRIRTIFMYGKSSLASTSVTITFLLRGWYI